MIHIREKHIGIVRAVPLLSDAMLVKGERRSGMFLTLLGLAM
jgi:hypothetical protein